MTHLRTVTDDQRPLDPVETFAAGGDYHRLRLNALLAMPDQQVRNIMLGLGLVVHPHASQDAMARDIIIREDHFPFYCWTIGGKHRLVLADFPPIRTPDVAAVFPIHKERLGDRWCAICQHVAAQNNVERARGTVPDWHLVYGGRVSEATCEAALSHELDEYLF